MDSTRLATILKTGSVPYTLRQNLFSLDVEFKQLENGNLLIFSSYSGNSIDFYSYCKSDDIARETNLPYMKPSGELVLPPQTSQNDFKFPKNDIAVNLRGEQKTLVSIKKIYFGSYYRLRSKEDAIKEDYDYAYSVIDGAVQKINFGNKQEALEDLDLVLRFIRDEKALLNRGKLKYEFRDIDGAKKDFSELLNGTYDSVAKKYLAFLDDEKRLKFDAFEQTAKEKYNVGDLNGAISATEEALVFGNTAELHIFRAELFAKAGDLGRAVKEDPRFSYLYYLTPLNNLESILNLGILSRNAVNTRKLSHTDASNLGVQDNRHQRLIEMTDGVKRPLHDCANMYLIPNTASNIMMRRAHDIDFALILISKEVLADKEITFAFSDGNLGASLSTVYTDYGDLKKLDWDLLSHDKASYYEGYEFNEYKRKRCAEVLIYACVPPKYFKKIVVKNMDAAHKIKKLLGDKNLNIDLETGLENHITN